MGGIRTREGYDLWAGAYDAFENPMVGITEWALDRRPAEVAGRQVVELGCGTGRNAARLLAGGAAAYTGVDNSEGMLERARARPSDPRVRWQCGSIERALDLPGAGFEFAFIALVLEHFDRLDAIFSELGRLLRPGGEVRILEIHPDLVRSGTKAHFWHEGREIQLPSFPHDESEYRAAARAAGVELQAPVEWRADDEVVRAIPKLARHAGRAVLMDLHGSKSGSA